jgi:hypothetical protein
MAQEHEIEFTRDEVLAMQGINNAPALGETTATEPHVSKRLVDHGYVTNDESGHLVLTVKGKRLLKAAS